MHVIPSLGLLSVLFVGTAYASPSRWHRAGEKAIYLQTNAVEGNSIVALAINRNGTLGKGTLYPTTGKGGNHVDAMTMQPVARDALLSQSSVNVVGHYLFATNAMSNSVSMFRIDAHDATSLQHISTTSITDAQFPTTVAASLKHNLVCVATTGHSNGVSCAKFSARGIDPFDGLRPLGLIQSTPPTGPPNTVSQVSFTADEDFLLVTVKANPTANTSGFVAAYAVQDSCLAREPVRSSPKDTAILFGFTQIPRSNNVIVTDPSIGAAILAFDPRTAEVSTVKPINITGQSATCWSTISDATGTAFVADVGVDRLVEISVPGGDIVSTTDLGKNGAVGMLDLVAVGEFLYALAPANGTASSGVTVFNAKEKMMVQHVDLGALGVGPNAQGMAAFL